MMEAGYQQAGSPAPEGIAVGDRRRWPRAAVVAGAVAAALLVGAATRGRPPPVAALATADATTAGEAATPFRVGAYSEGFMRPNDWIWNKRDDREESRGAIPNAHAHSDLGNVTRVQPNSHSPPAITDDDYKEAGRRSEPRE